MLGMLLGELVLSLRETSVAARDLRKCVVGIFFWNQAMSVEINSVDFIKYENICYCE
tara:strand:+ start:574 stop:744 length:171 start_codon:yes stop_codon:yes gene_type:complete